MVEVAEVAVQREHQVVLAAVLHIWIVKVALMAVLVPLVKVFVVEILQVMLKAALVAVALEHKV
jgi:hypothetical protein